MSRLRQHPYIATLVQQYTTRAVNRREFLRTATLLGLSATTAYAIAGKIDGRSGTARAQSNKPKGGTLRLSTTVYDVKSPATASTTAHPLIYAQVVEHLTKTGADNVTRPHLLESWSPSEDLRTWELKIRPGVTWHSGRAFTADDIVWNLTRLLSDQAGSSVLGLMKGYMLNAIDTGEVNERGRKILRHELWDANAIEKVDDRTVRLNLKAPQLAVPEHLFHYPFAMLDPEEGGKFGVGSNGTGPFELAEHEIGVQSVLKARGDYWGEGPHLDTLRFIDLGDDASAYIGALASKQVDGLFAADVSQIDVLKTLPHVQIFEAATAETAVARVKVDQKPFDDARVRKAMKLAVDQKQVLDFALRGLGLMAEHHHVCEIHPEYAKLDFMGRDVEGAKALLEEAGYGGGLDLEIVCPNEPAWQPAAVQGMVEQWKDAGIRVKINIMPGAQFWDVWDKVPFGYTIWYHRPLGVMVLGLGYRSGVPWNESGFANADFDRLLAKAEGTLDVDERRALMAEIEAIMQEDGPIVQPVWRSVFTFYDKRVQGFAQHPTNYIFGEELAIEG